MPALPPACCSSHCGPGIIIMVVSWLCAQQSKAECGIGAALAQGAIPRCSHP